MRECLGQIVGNVKLDVNLLDLESLLCDELLKMVILYLFVLGLCMIYMVFNELCCAL